MLEIMALVNPSQLKESSVNEAIDTPKTTGPKTAIVEGESVGLKQTLMVCVKDTATAANETLDMTCPNA